VRNRGNHLGRIWMVLGDLGKVMTICRHVAIISVVARKDVSACQSFKVALVLESTSASASLSLERGSECIYQRTAFGLPIQLIQWSVIDQNTKYPGCSTDERSSTCQFNTINDPKHHPKYPQLRQKSMDEHPSACQFDTLNNSESAKSSLEVSIIFEGQIYNVLSTNGLLPADSTP